ncbi:hypothetical protein [Leisingera sp. ANG-M1]|uniref:hypothetical protein n=1 Tax=Leisingera sp. ANG-M1 TaxID=1577895 RepID=UPI001269A610|nr:hypothetical protein [Leisingera sp. ANG-M1]
MRLRHLPIGSVNKAAKMLVHESAASLSQCREVISTAVGYKDYFDLSRNGPTEPGEHNLSEDQLIEIEITTTAQISNQLGVGPVAAQHVLANTIFRSGRTSDMSRAIQVITQVFEKTALPPQGWRQPGQIGKLKSPGRNGEHVILREFGRPTRVITHKSANAGVADFEYIGPRTPLPLFIPMRLYVPYGVWTEQDGSRVLFSRDYFPMWRLREGKTPERMNPWERINFVEETWLLSEGQMPWYNSNNFNLCISVLERAEIRSFPRLLEALPLIVKDPSVGDYRQLAKVLKARASS